MSGQDARVAIARLYRRAGFGLAPGELDALEALGVDAVVDRLVDPDAHGIPAAPADLWAGVELPPLDAAVGVQNAVFKWLDHLSTTERPFEEWMGWYWHGHLVSGIVEVGFPATLVEQLNLYRNQGLGPFRSLLRAATVDPAMLRYLNGDESTKAAPNENFARELLELFSLGIGNYTEDDIRAGAKALTGWKVDLVGEGTPEDPTRTVARFDPADHDDRPQRYLGVSGVHDVDTVIDAVVAQEACADFVTARFGTSILGPEADPALLRRLAGRFRDSDLDLRVLARGVLEATADGDVADLVIGPMPWLLAIQRATEAELDPMARYVALADAGHLPMWPPNVSGWHGGTTWLSSSTTALRYNLAGTVAAAAPESNPARQAAVAGDLALLADALGRPEGFSETTQQALADLAADSGRDGGVGLLAAAMAAPDLVVA